MRVLVVEDEVVMAEAVRIALERAAIAADVVHDGESALEALAVNDYDAVLLDRDLPGIHGDDVAKQIAASEMSVRVLMLTAARGLDDKVEGFEIGADDYLSKPFEVPELIARLRALERRPALAHPPVLKREGIELNPFRREVSRSGAPIPLTRKEFSVLHLLMQAEGGVISAEEILEKAWDVNANPFTNSVRVTISILRKKLGTPWVIHTVKGVGYRIGPENG